MGQAAFVVLASGLATGLVAQAGCEGKVLRLGESTGSLDAGGASAVDAARDVSADSDGCPHAQVKANEVLWIGDSWVTLPGDQHTRVRDLARATGAIGPSDDYVISAASALTLNAIIGRYDTQQAGPTKVKVLIMDGGTWDTYLSNGADKTVTDVVSTFTQFLAKVASDGTVEHVIYFLVPDSIAIPGVAALSPGLRQACEASKNVNKLPCYFLDLKQVWQGHSDYTDPVSSVQATQAGAIAIGDAIWKLMQQNCIAQ